MIGIRVVVEQMAWADDKLFEFLSQLPDEAWRTQIAAALKSGGFALPDLEDFSTWAYAAQKG